MIGLIRCENFVKTRDDFSPWVVEKLGPSSSTYTVLKNLEALIQNRYLVLEYDIILYENLTILHYRKVTSVK